jgi:pyridoxine 4-dehydrogenase
LSVRFSFRNSSTRAITCGGFSPLQSSQLSDVAAALGATPIQVALAWLLQRAPNILLIAGTSSVDHLRENLKAADLKLEAESVQMLDSINSQPTPALSHAGKP